MLIDIKSATEIDKDFILSANKEILTVSGLTKSDLEKNIDVDINGDNGKFLIAKSDNKNVGMAVYSDIYWADNGKGIYLSQIYTVPEYRGKGIVKQIFKYIMDNNDCNFITCLVGPDNECMMRVMDSIGAEKEDLMTYVLERNRMII